MINRSNLKQHAKSSLSGKWGIAIGTLIVAEIILAAATLIPLGSIILTGVVSVGLIIVYLEIVRNWQCEFGDLFKGFNNFGTNCCCGVLTAIYTFLWSLLFVIPGIVKAYSYSMSFYILADNPNMTASEAITASRAMMDGHKADLFVLHLSFIPWLLLCGITFGLAGLYVFPYMQATEAAFYDSIKDEKFAPADNAQFENSEI